MHIEYAKMYNIKRYIPVVITNTIVIRQSRTITYSSASHRSYSCLS